MNFLEAIELNKYNSSNDDIQCSIFMSGLSNPLELYIRGYFSTKGFNLKLKTIPFDSLHQSVINLNTYENYIMLVFPWDLVPELNWRSGFPSFKYRDIDDVNIRLIENLKGFDNVKIFYIPAIFPYMFHNFLNNIELSNRLTSIMLELNARIINPKFFSLKNFLNIGCPIGNNSLSKVSKILVEEFVNKFFIKEKKVIVTDFDGVLWSGIIGDDGINGIHYDQSVLGYIHYIYQTYLKNLKDRGVLICGVSRNYDSVAKLPFKQGDMVLTTDDFVSILASFNSKSEQLQLLSEKLNLNLDSFVFIDDNEFELMEVSTKLQQVECLKFPKDADGFSVFITNLSKLFNQNLLTDEDKKRTDLYKRRVKSIVPRVTSEESLNSFLLSMEMELNIENRSNSNFDRALQLINKTNQFNINGIRQTHDNVSKIIKSGGSIYTASLSDISGGHGEVLACIVDSKGTVKSFAMSCRVFQRKLEYVFIYWLCTNLDINNFEYMETDKNKAFKEFISERIFINNDSTIINKKKLNSIGEKYKKLINIKLDSQNRK